MRCWRCNTKLRQDTVACRACGAAVIRGDQPSPVEVALALYGNAVLSPWAVPRPSRWSAVTRVLAVLALVLSPLVFGLLGAWTARRAEHANEGAAAAARSFLHVCVILGVVLNAVALAVLWTG